MGLATRSLSLFVLALGLVACGKTNREILQEHAPLFEAARGTLRGIAGQLPAPGTVTQVQTAKLDPVPVYDENGGNMAVLMAEQLADADAKPEFDLLMSSKLITPIQWTGPKNPMSESALGNRGTKVEEKLKQALDLRYLGVVRVLSFVKPVIVGDKFVGGQVKGELFVVDMTSKEVIASGPIAAHAPDQVDFTYREGESKEDAGKRFIKSTVWVAARADVKRVIEQIGGKVTLD